ncbi:MAG: VCBS repeat-containing protein [Candidatus Omnitrophica bacterium]|nr:VCBS repeat-containing protein [Candidatus Omnitrophota bacterium]
MIFSRLKKLAKEYGSSKMKKIMMLFVIVLSLQNNIYAGNKKLLQTTLKPGILVGESFISKSIFLESKRLGRVHNIVRGDLDAAPGAEIGITWDTCDQNGGAIFCNDDGEIISTVIFSSRAMNSTIIDVEKDGICEFLSGGSWSRKVLLLNHNGTPEWIFSSKRGVNGLGYADIDGDGKLEFALSFNGGGVVRLLESNGELIWKSDDSNAWHIEMADTNQDGNLEIISSNSRGSIKIRDKEGNILSDVRPEIYFNKFTISPWPSSKDREYIITSRKDEKVYVMDFGGKTIAKYNAPKTIKTLNICAAPIRLTKDKPQYFAVLIKLLASWRRSILYLYDDKGNIAYQEIIPDICESICVIDADKSGSQKILIGGTGKVWQYEYRGNSE